MQTHPSPFFFFFNDTATTEIYTLSLHDALPISTGRVLECWSTCNRSKEDCRPTSDRKSTRLNSSHDQISYAVFCLKKKKSTSTTSAYRSTALHILPYPPRTQLLSSPA